VSVLNSAESYFNYQIAILIYQIPILIQGAVLIQGNGLI
jgi:hypothetical protein